MPVKILLGSKIKIHIPVRSDAEDNSFPKGEYVWAIYTGNGLAKVNNIPFLVDAISLGDTVLIDEDCEVLDVIEKAANTKLARWSAPDKDSENQALWNIIKSHFESHDVPVESAWAGFFSLAVPLGMKDKKFLKICDECPVKVVPY